jgi:four helix bundle protein
MTPRHHEDLRVWKLAIELAVATHRFVDTFSTEHRIAYGDQFRRAAVSVAANIAEGSARQHRREFVQFLSIARGSLAELHTLREIARRLELTNPVEMSRLADLVDHTGRLLTLTIRAVSRRPVSRRA